MNRLLLPLALTLACGSADDSLDAISADAHVDSRDAAAPLDGAMPPRDMGAEPFDGGPLADDDAGPSESDMGPPRVDMGPASPCRAGEVYDAVADKCYGARPYFSGDLCPIGQEALRWVDEDDQRRIEALVAPLGGGGTGLIKNAFTGVWRFADTGDVPPSIDWAAGHPEHETYRWTWLSPSDGLRSTFRTSPTQYCMRDPL